jgi:hypothetical protein
MIGYKEQEAINHNLYLWFTVCIQCLVVYELIELCWKCPRLLFIHQLSEKQLQYLPIKSIRIIYKIFNHHPV